MLVVASISLTWGNEDSCDHLRAFGLCERKEFVHLFKCCEVLKMMDD